MPKLTTKKALNLCVKLNTTLTFATPNNYGGFDHSSVPVMTIKDGKLFFVTTCGNCGQGTWIDITNLIK